MSELLTVRDVAHIMQISEDTAARIFAKVEGVIDLGRSETRNRRRYRVLRIPKAVLEAYLSRKAGKTVTVNVPVLAAKYRRVDNWEWRAVMNLAKAGLQNECTDKKVYQKIADRANLFTKVPQAYWAEIAETPWTDPEEDERDAREQEYYEQIYNEWERGKQ